MDSKKLGQTIKKIRVSQNLSIKEVSANAEITYSYLYKLENGVYNITVKCLEKLCKALNFNIIDFFVLYEHMEKFDLVNPNDKV